MAEGEATYREHMDKANASFAEKRKKLEEENDVKIKLVRSSLRKDFDEKVQKQERRFTKKRNELQARIKDLEKGERQMASRLRDAKDAKTRAEEEIAALRRDLSELHQQVGPVTDLAEKAQRDAQLAKVMTCQRKRLLRDLVTRARTVAERLGTEAPPFSAEGDEDEAGYAGFFERFLGRLEENVCGDPRDRKSVV